MLVQSVYIFRNIHKLRYARLLKLNTLYVEIAHEYMQIPDKFRLLINGPRVGYWIEMSEQFDNVH